MKLKILSFISCVLVFHCASARFIEFDNELSNVEDLEDGYPLQSNSVHRSHVGRKHNDEKMLTVIPLGYNIYSKHNGLTVAYKFNQTKLSWNQAGQACREEGGYLAYPNNGKEARVYSKVVRRAGVGGAWIGLHDLFEEGDWITVLGEKVKDLKFIDWASTEPNNYEGKENCAEIYDKDGKWYDTECSKKLNFLCKIFIRS